MSKFEKVIEVLSTILVLCAIAGGFLFFVMCIGALFSGQITIGSKL